MLSCHGLSKSFEMGDTRVGAVRDVDLDLQPSQLVVIAGASGSGKTTLLNLIGLIDRPDSGSLALDGEELAGAPERHRTRIRRERIGFVFQDFNLVPVLTAAENVEYPLLLLGWPAARRRQRVAESLERVGLGHRCRHRPGRLSGGEQQRVAVARALVKQPRLVIADEPTANLDSTNTGGIISIMAELGASEGTTFLVASHDPVVIDQADRVVWMRDGEITGGAS
jgi:putative ABC transport system ATP-binding protein